MGTAKLVCLTFSVSDYIAIVNILVTGGIGLWIALFIQNNITKERFEKEHFINEVKEVKDLYKIFINKLYKGSMNAKDIKEWFKVMTGKIKSLEACIEERFEVDGASVATKHAEIQQKVTILEEYNENYKLDRVVFKESSKNDILVLHTALSNVITEKIIGINSAKKKKRKSCKNK